jgi:hypothetical protein
MFCASEDGYRGPLRPVFERGAVRAMPKGLQRISGLGHLHSATFSCYHRLPLLRSERALRFARSAAIFSAASWILPGCSPFRHRRAPSSPASPHRAAAQPRNLPETHVLQQSTGGTQALAFLSTRIGTEYCGAHDATTLLHQRGLVCGCPFAPSAKGGDFRARFPSGGEPCPTPRIRRHSVRGEGSRLCLFP